MLEARPGKSGAERFARPTVVTLLAVINLLSGIAWLAVVVTDFVSHWPWPQADSESLFMVMVSVALAGLMVVCGYGLWTLKSYARTILLVLCCVGVFFFPLGTFASL